MQYIDQDKLALISPLQVVAGVPISYYSLSPILEGNILYTVTPERTILWKIGRTSCVKIRRGIMIGGTTKQPLLARYIVRTFLQEISEGPARNRHLDELIALEALPC
jgi:hypothetical protein